MITISGTRRAIQLPNTAATHAIETPGFETGQRLEAMTPVQNQQETKNETMVIAIHPAHQKTAFKAPSSLISLSQILSNSKKTFSTPKCTIDDIIKSFACFI